MIKRCPIMSKQTSSHSSVYCFEKECAFWDEEMNMCCIKSAAIAVASNRNGKTRPSYISYEQAQYIPPSVTLSSDTDSPYVITY